jgi:hypothetical protein
MRQNLPCPLGQSEMKREGLQHNADAKNMFHDCYCRQTHPQGVEHCEKCVGPRVTQHTWVRVQHGRLARKPARMPHFQQITMTDLIEWF